MGGGNSGLSHSMERRPEQKKQEEIYRAVKQVAAQIKDEPVEWMIGFDKDTGEEIQGSRTTDNKRSSVTPDLALIHGQIAIHNHPRGWCFSGADCYCAIYLHELWAVTSGLVQRFKWNQGTSRASAYAFMRIADKKSEACNKKAIEKWDKLNPKPEFKSAQDVNEYYERMNRETTLMAQRMYRTWFKNNAKRYGYTISFKRW